MEQILNKLFSYQRIAENQTMSALIADTCSRWNPGTVALSDDEADLVSAAGTGSYIPQEQTPGTLEQSVLQNSNGGRL